MGTMLHDVKRGEAFRIDAVADDEVRAQFHRMGFLDGTVECSHRVTGGPVVISRRGTDLAVGATVATDVEISVTEQ